MIPPKRTTEEASKTAPLMVMVGSWSTYYQVAAHNGFGANITVPTRRPERNGRRARRGLRLLGRPRRGQPADGLQARRGDRRRPFGRGQGARRRDLRGLDDALQRGPPRRLRDPRPASRTGTTSPAIRSASTRRSPVADDAVPERHEVPDPDPWLRLAGRGPLRDLVGPERPDGVVEPARRSRTSSPAPTPMVHDGRPAARARASGPSGRSTARTSS